MNDDDIYQRLLGMCRCDPDTGCREWTGGMGGTNARTPTFHFPRNGNNRRSIAAYKAAWLLTGRTIPAGHCVYRACLNWRCVNPDHCKTGTNKQMWAHRKRNGECVISADRAMRNRINSQANMTPVETVRRVEQMLAEGVKRNDIAAQLGVSKGTVTHIRRGRHFHCVNRPKVARGASVFAL